MLRMKAACERCQTTLDAARPACICSFECTFCMACSQAMDHVCPNCSGELVPRPRRTRKVADVAVSQVRSKLEKIFNR